MMCVEQSLGDEQSLLINVMEWPSYYCWISQVQSRIVEPMTKYVSHNKPLMTNYQYILSAHWVILVLV